MSSRAYDIMNELPAIFGAVPGLDAANVQIGYRDPKHVEAGELPMVMVYNPTTEEPAAPVFGLRAIEYGYAILIVNALDTDDATMEICEDMASDLPAASLVNADTAYMNPGSIITSEATKGRTVVVALMLAQWEGL